MPGSKGFHLIIAAACIPNLIRLAITSYRRLQ